MVEIVGNDTVYDEVHGIVEGIFLYYFVNFVVLCCAQHNTTYVASDVMLRGGPYTTAGNARLHANAT